MNNQSPLIPQGSFQEQRNTGRARLKIAIFLVLAIHGIGLMALLMQGCKKEPDAGTNAAAATNETTNTPPPFVEPTNSPAATTNVAETPTNAMPTPQPPVVESPSPTPPTATPGTDYVIVKGDTFSTIHQKFHVSIKALQEANPTVEPTKLKIGQTIHIPPTTPASPTPAAAVSGSSSSGAAPTGQVYTVKSGDSLTRIAGQFGVSIKALRSFNSLKTDKIVVGQKLNIPPKSSTTTTAPSSTGASAPAGTTSGQ